MSRIADIRREAKRAGLLSAFNAIREEQERLERSHRCDNSEQIGYLRAQLIVLDLIDRIDRKSQEVTSESRTEAITDEATDGILTER